MSEDEYNLVKVPDESNIKEVNEHIYFYRDASLENVEELAVCIHGLNYEYENKKIKPPIHFHLLSYGGDAMAGFVMMDIVKESKRPVYIYVEGYVASSATLCVVVAKKRFMKKNAFLLIHQIVLNDINKGKTNDLTDEVKNLEIMTSTYKNIYQKYTKMNRKNIDFIMNNEKILTAKECKKYGIIDKII